MVKMSRRCLICCSFELNLVNVSNVVGDERWNDNDTIPVHFITRKLLNLSEGICHEILRLTASDKSAEEKVVARSSRDCDDIYRFELCENCYCIVNKALDCHRKILNLQREISVLGETLVQFVQESKEIHDNRIDGGFNHLRELLSTESEENIKESHLIKNEVESETDSDDGGHEDPVPMDDSILDEANDGDPLNDTSDYEAEATENGGRRNSEMEISSDECSQPGEPVVKSEIESDADSDYIPEDDYDKVLVTDPDNVAIAYDSKSTKKNQYLRTRSRSSTNLEHAEQSKESDTERLPILAKKRKGVDNKNQSANNQESPVSAHVQHLESHNNEVPVPIPNIRTKKKKSKVKSGTGSELNCPKCKFTASEERRLIRHMLKSHKMVRNACDICGYFGERGSRYIKHMLDVHSITVTKWNPLVDLSAPGSSAKTYQCPCCESISTNLSKFKSHEEVHKESDKLGSKFDCPVCLFPHLARADLKRHLKNVHDQDGDIVDACKKSVPRAGIDISIEKISKRPGKIIAHGDRVYLCKMCDKAYTTFSMLTVHMQSHYKSQVKGNQFNCDVCNYPCSDAKALGKHKRSAHDEKNLKCEKCGKAFSKKQSYLDHLEIHKRQEALFDPETGLYKCPICPFRGPFRGVSRHKALAHVDSTEEVHQKKHLCSECGAHFRCPSKLRKHIRNKHENIFQYNCDICKKGFEIKSQYEYHVKTHDKNRVCDFVCEWCGAAYLTEASLRIHVAAAHPEKVGHVPTSIQKRVTKPGNYKCKWCDITLPNRHLLVNIHYPTMHKDKYKFKCDICGKVFSSIRDTNCHKTKLHPNDMKFEFVCELCNKGFRLHCNLISHKKTCSAQASTSVDT